MTVLAGLWFIVMTLEHLVYRKTGTCNDINVNNNDFTCFNLKNHSLKIDCTSEEAMDPNIEVFCYLYHFSPSAVAIGFSTYQFILFLTVLFFKIAVEWTQCACCGKRSCSVCAVFAQVLIAALSFLVVLVLCSTLHFRNVLRMYFFEGKAVYRVAMFVLLAVSFLVGIFTPWFGFMNIAAKPAPVVPEEKQPMVPQVEPDGPIIQDENEL